MAATETNESWSKEKPYPVYSSQTKDNGLMGYFSDYLYKDSITWTTDGANAGTVNYRPGKFYCTNVCGVLLSDNVKANKMLAEAINNVSKGYVSYVGNPKLMNNVMADIEVKIPKEESERDNISILFNQIDNLITLHQRKLYAKIYDWEQRKFEDELQTVTDYVAAGSFADLAENVKYLNVPDYAQLVRTMDLKNNFTSKEQIFVDKKAFDYLWRVNLNKESIILPNIGNCGEIYLINKEKLKYKNNVLGPNAILVRSITNNNKFLSYSFQTKRFQDNLKLIISPNGQTKFNKTDLKTIEIIIPKTLEQAKIGNLLNTIDNLITLHQQ